jgi:hypothetical protein
MAHDLILKKSSHDWSRNETSSGSEACTERPSRGFPIIGTAISLMFATRILSGKWPWYWFSRHDQR